MTNRFITAAVSAITAASLATSAVAQMTEIGEGEGDEYFAENPELITFKDISTDQQIDEKAIQVYLTSQHQKVIDLYEYLVSRAETPGTIEKLERLLELEQQGLKQMMQSSNRHMDM